MNPDRSKIKYTWQALIGCHKSTWQALIGRRKSHRNPLLYLIVNYSNKI